MYRNTLIEFSGLRKTRQSTDTKRAEKKYINSIVKELKQYGFAYSNANKNVKEAVQERVENVVFETVGNKFLICVSRGVVDGVER